MMISEIISSMLAGLGLLFLALKILESSMHELTSGYVRGIIKKNTSNNLQAGFWGSLMGLVAGDPAVVGFIAASLYTCHSIGLNRAMIMSTWSNVGACCLFFIVFIDIDLLVLYFLGIMGFVFYIEKPFKWRHFIGCLFAICLMLYSLTLMQSQSEKIVDIPWIKESLSGFQSSNFKPFVIAAFLTVLIQGADIVVLVLIANLFNAHILTLDQAIFMLFGMHLGLAIINTIITLSLRGVMKQILMIQILVDTTIAIGFAFLIALEIYTGIPMLKALISSFTHSIWAQLIFLIFFSNVVVSFLFSIFMEPISRLIGKIFPAVETIDPAEPKYIGDINIKDPESALDLVDKEIFDLLQRIPKAIEYRILTPNSKIYYPELQIRHEQFVAVILPINEILKGLNTQALSTITGNRLLKISDRLQIAISLEEGVHHLTQITPQSLNSESLQRLSLQILEAQQAQIETILEAILERSDEDISLLIQATANIKPAIEEIRQAYLKNEVSSSIEGKSIILNMTSLFERNVWLLRRLTYQFIPKKLLEGSSLNTVPLDL